MKRLLSWLLALVMIISCLPMSVLPAFAAETDVETGTEDPDFGLDMWELLPGGSAENRLLVEFTMNAEQTEGTASVTVPAGMTLYAEYQGDPTYELSVDGVAHEFVAATGRNDTNKFEITNDTDAKKTYELKVALPVGTYNNPKVIESMEWYSDEVVQAQGDYEGYYYIYTATETGNVTFSVDAVYDDNYEVVDCGIQDIAVTNLNTYASYTLQNNGEDNYGLELVVPVEAGQTLRINTSWIEDAAGNAYPAGTYSWTGYFTYPAGTEQNPNAIKWNWNEDGTTATASVTVESDGQYYTGVAGMILTVDGVETAMDENGKFTLAAGEHALQLATPAGAWNNPAQLVIGENTATVAAGAWGGYMYTWTAEEDGTLSLTMPSNQGWFYAVTNKTTGVSGDGQWSDSDSVANPATIEVAAGDVLSIEVNTYNPEDPYNNPGGTVTFTAAFEAAVKCDHSSLGANAVCPSCGLFNLYGANMNLGNSLAVKFFVQASKLTSTDYIEISQVYGDGRTAEPVIFTFDQLQDNGSYKFAEYSGLHAKMMNDEITVTVKNADGKAISVDYKFTMSSYAVRLFNAYANNAELRAAVVDMINYGAAAQTFFKYDVENLASNVLTDEMIPYASAPVDLVTNQVKGDNYYGTVLSLESSILMTMYFSNVTTDMKAVVTYTDFKGASVSYEIAGSEFDTVKYSGKCGVVVNTLQVADGCSVVSVEIYDGDTVVASASDSIESIMYRYKNAGYTDAIYTEIMKFATSARAYLT